MKRTTKTITLGSGKPYAMEYSGDALPDVETICTEPYLLGYTKGGAALTYTTTDHEERDDLGLVSKVVITAEEALLKLGLLTWNGNCLAKLADRCQVTEDTAKGTRTIKLGGAGNAQGKKWVVCFFHEDKKEGNLWVLVVGNNSAGISLTFAQDAGTVVEPEFKALPQDDKGTLVTIVEEIDKATS